MRNFPVTITLYWQLLTEISRLVYFNTRYINLFTSWSVEWGWNHDQDVQSVDLRLDCGRTSTVEQIIRFGWQIHLHSTSLHHACRDGNCPIVSGTFPARETVSTWPDTPRGYCYCSGNCGEGLGNINQGLCEFTRRPKHEDGNFCLTVKERAKIW